MLENSPLLIDQLENEQLLAAQETHIHSTECEQFQADKHVDTFEGGHGGDCRCAECTPDQAREQVDRHVHDETCGHLPFEKAAHEIDRGERHEHNHRDHARHSEQQHHAHDAHHHNETAQVLKEESNLAARSQEALRDITQEEIANRLERQKAEEASAESVKEKIKELKVRGPAYKAPERKAEPIITPAQSKSPERTSAQVAKIVKDDVGEKLVVVRPAVVQERSMEPLKSSVGDESDTPQIISEVDAGEMDFEYKPDTFSEGRSGVVLDGAETIPNEETALYSPEELDVFNSPDLSLGNEAVTEEVVILPSEQVETVVTEARLELPQLPPLETIETAEADEIVSEMSPEDTVVSRLAAVSLVAEAIADQLPITGAIEVNTSDEAPNEAPEKLFARLEAKLLSFKSGNELTPDMKHDFLQLMELIGFENAEKTLDGYIDRFGNEFLADLLLRLFELRNYAQHNESIGAYQFLNDRTQPITSSIGRAILSLLGLSPQLSV